MIRIYILYSYGMVGYQTYLVEGQANESMTQVPETSMPEGTSVFFAKQGYAKVVLRHVANQHMTLAIEAVPSPHTDPFGRPIPCNIQFVGGRSDGETLCKLAVRICSDFDAFGAFFQGLISDRRGLRIEGDRLRAYVDECAGYDVAGNRLAEALNLKKTSGVLFLSPFSEGFEKDADIRQRVLEALDINERDMKGALVIPYPKLKELQLPDELEKMKRELEQLKEEKEVLTASLKKKETESEQLRTEIKRLQEKQGANLPETSSLKQEIASLQQTVNMYKGEYETLQSRSKVLLLVAALSVILNIILFIIH